MSVANIVATSLCDVNRPPAGGYSSFKVHIFVRMMIEDGRIPAFHIRANQKRMGVKINGKNRCFIEKNSFGLLKCAIPRRLFASPTGFGN